MGCACSPKTVQRVMQSTGYHKHIYPRDPVESSGHRSTCHRHMRSGRGFCGLTNPHSPPSDHRKKNTILIASTELSTRAAFCGGIKSELVFIPGDCYGTTFGSSAAEVLWGVQVGGSSGGWCIRPQGACQKIPRVERNGCALMACIATRPQSYRGIVAGRGGSVRSNLG